MFLYSIKIMNYGHLTNPDVTMLTNSMLLHIIHMLEII